MAGSSLFTFILYIPWNVVPAHKEISVVEAARKAVSCEEELSVGLVEAGEGHSFLERMSGKFPWKRWAVSLSLHIDTSWFLPSCFFKQGPRTRIPVLLWYLPSCCLLSGFCVECRFSGFFTRLSTAEPIVALSLTLGLLATYVLEILAFLSLIWSLFWPRGCN